jgi:diadenylate cyclase
LFFVPEIIKDLIDYLAFIFERLDWLSVLDILLVTSIFFVIFLLVRDTQAIVLLRGGFILLLLLGVLTTLEVLPAFSWLVSNTLPALLVAIPVIFAPEIRRALERLGRTGSFFSKEQRNLRIPEIVNVLVAATTRLADRNHGALIVIRRYDNLRDYLQTGVPLNADITPELLLQIFYPNTPLHDGAAILSGPKVIAASCVLPLSSSGSLLRTPERQMGLRHRAALGLSEVSDAVSLVVSEETGAISITANGRIFSNLTTERVENILLAIYEPFEKKTLRQRLFSRNRQKSNMERI